MTSLARALPREKGVDSRLLAGFLDTVAAEKMELHSFLIYRSGAIVAEGYWHPYAADRLHMQHSSTKSWTATGIGFLIDDGLVKFEDKVVTFFPDDLPPQVSEHLAAMTVRDLLTMRTGHKTGISGGEWRGSRESWVKAFFREEVSDPPGKTFIYSSASSYMLSAIVTKVTGRTLHEFLEERLFAPLGMGKILWDLSPEGFNTGGNGLRCVSEDVVKFGVLHLNKGVRDGTRILSKEWVEAATSNQVDEVWMGALDGKRFLAPGTPGAAPAEKREGYGYQWWMTAHGGYRASGLYGQQCIVLPEQDAVIVFTGGLKPRDPRLMDAVYSQIIPALSGKADAEADEALEVRLKNLAMDVPDGVPASPTSEAVNGNIYVAEENDAGIKAIELSFDGSLVSLRLEDHRGSHIVTASCNGLHEGSTTMTGNTLHHEYQPDLMVCLANAAWISDRHLQLQWRFVETAFCDTVDCRFGDEGMTFDRQVNTNAGPLRMPTVTAHHR